MGTSYFNLIYANEHLLNRHGSTVSKHPLSHKYREVPLAIVVGLA
jgi:hypothetical protein